MGLNGEVKTWDGAQWVQTQASSSSDIPDSGISRLTFDDADTGGGTATDVWGGYDGTINGATTGVSGELGEAYSFDGNDDEVFVSDVVSNGIVSGAFSVSVWVYLEGTGLQGIFDFLNQTEDTLLYHVDSGGGPWHFSTNSGQSDEVQAGTNPTQTWTHLVATVDGSEQTLYQDGSQIGSNTDAVSISYSDGIVFGQYGSGNFFGGRLDDPRVYGKALTATEVSNLYNSGSI
jgi:hypothetical protein